MELDEEILARVRAAKAWDKDAELSDFQFNTIEGGAVLIHLKTGRSQIIYDDNAELSELNRLLAGGGVPNATVRRTG